ncbi:Uncharacterised protein [Mycobacteroides abscessus subsp. abscessus]|nr:Uncharacterised protein [Mycobacteroides abscessus subsp. abscessus]
MRGPSHVTNNRTRHGDMLSGVEHRRRGAEREFHHAGERYAVDTRPIATILSRASVTVHCLIIAPETLMRSVPNPRLPSLSHVRRYESRRRCADCQPRSTALEIRWSILRISTPLPSLTLICPARVHSSISALKSSMRPAFSLDHIVIDEYGSE